MAVHDPRKTEPAASNPRRYLRTPSPLFFPEEEEMPETGIHLEVRTALYQIIQLQWGDRAKVGSEQFVYWDPTDPKKKLAPDVMVWVGGPDEPFSSWRVWERGAPHVSVEVVSRSDSPDLYWEIKLERYRRCGVREVVRFDADETEQPLRLWDLVEGDMVERVLVGPNALLCDALGAYWCVVKDPTLGFMLRLSPNPDGTDLFPTPDEARKLEAEGRRLEAEGRKLEAEARKREEEARKREEEARKLEVEARKRETVLRQEETAARERAEQRIRELEAELAKRTQK
jgi:Uma2 family endonuclease